jgi:hypothetical protein
VPPSFSHRARARASGLPAFGLLGDLSIMHVISHTREVITTQDQKCRGSKSLANGDWVMGRKLAFAAIMFVPQSSL